MTTVFLAEKQCFACGSKSQYPLVDLNLSIIGPRDLDGRPSLIQRSSVYLWVQRCYCCGYCAPEITQGNNDDLEVIDSPEYQKQLNDPDFPETANTFLCHSMIMTNSELFADAGWAKVFAAWICDDNGYKEAAIKCRRMAFQCFTRAKANNQDFGETPSLEKLYLIDILRRSGDLTQAAALCDKELENTHDEQIINLLCYEQELIDNSDCGCHSTTEAEDEEL
ncbi:MAG: hypothetical protein GX640_24525 [Fibrobacter sp.]|nr:hypothetical protein [Fibrobacter sp.]